MVSDREEGRGPRHAVTEREGAVTEREGAVVDRGGGGSDEESGV